MICMDEKKKVFVYVFAIILANFLSPGKKESLYSFRRIIKFVFLLNNIYIYFRIKCYKNAWADTAALYLANN